jgi:hexosaminidase
MIGNEELVDWSGLDALVPRPSRVVRGHGEFVLDAETRLVADPSTLDAAKTVQETLGPATGLLLALTLEGEHGTSGGAVALELRRELAELGAEGYRLAVEEGGIKMIAAAPAGLFYATQTLRQLLSPDIYRSAPAEGRRWVVPAVQVEDRPRFTWRGAMLDVGRYFLPKSFLLRFVDLLAMHKYNVLHLHLTEDQGWRFPVRGYPRLTEVGSWRKETLRGHRGERGGDGTPHGGFYTADDLRELVSYAARRFVTIVPEIDLPGHTRAAIASYPWLGNSGQAIEVKTGWGIETHVLNMEEKTLQFCRDVLSEVMEIFPAPFVHIGGDECPRTEWEQSKPARQRAAELGLAEGVEGLQAWFTSQLAAFLADNGRRLIGWDEIIEGGLAPGAAVMSWRSEEGGIVAARAGHDVVMTPEQWCYFNYYESDDPREPLAHPSGCTPLERAYAYEPLPAGLSGEASAHVLGTQFAIWTEYAPDPATVEYLTFPRACAHAEVAWSKSHNDWDGFRARVSRHLGRLEALGVNFRPLEGPHPWQEGGTGDRQRPSQDRTVRQAVDS